MKKILLLIMILMLSAAACSCTKISDEEAVVEAMAAAEEPQPYPVTAGGLVFNTSPRAVACLSPAVTEIIFELGFGDRLVCRSIYCDYPEAALSIPSAGSAANPDFESIIGARPDLLITQSPIANKDMTRLSSEGIAVLWLPSPSSVEGLYENYSIISLIFSGSIEGESRAAAALSDFGNAVNGANGSCESLVFIMNVSPDGFSVGTGDSFAGDYIGIFGKNIAEDNTSFSMTADELTAADPQIIFLADPISSSDIDEEISSRLSAFREGHVYVIDASLTERPTSRLAGLTRSISKKVREDTGGAAAQELSVTEITDSPEAGYDQSESNYTED